VRIFVVEQTMSTINSFCHLVGDRAHATRDESRNIAWAGLVTWGESHHNNHHSAPASASFGEGPGELDPGYWFIRALQALSLVSNVRLPKRSARIAEE
jgi:stearoyl-CoA desaturase (Delta-9 desaturase)